MLRFCRYLFLNFPHKHKSNVSGICILDDILDRACYCDSRGGVCWCSSWHLVSFLLWDKNCLPFMAYFSDYQVCYKKYLNIVLWAFDTFAALLCQNTLYGITEIIMGLCSGAELCLGFYCLQLKPKLFLSLCPLFLAFYVNWEGY